MEQGVLFRKPSSHACASRFEPTTDTMFHDMVGLGGFVVRGSCLLATPARSLLY